MSLCGQRFAHACTIATTSALAVAVLGAGIAGVEASESRELGAAVNVQNYADTKASKAVEVLGRTGSGQSLKGLRDHLIALTNSERRRTGCKPLKEVAKLQSSAQAHASDMSARRYLSHTSKSGRSFDRRIRSTGFDARPFGENIASGYYSVGAVHQAWMRSPSHRENILYCKFSKVGVGIHPRGGYWVQDFGG